MYLIGLLLIPVLIGGGVFLVFDKTITIKEFGLQLAISITLIIGAWFAARYGALQDTEHLNGRITEKLSGTESCCHCTTVCDSRDKNGSCTRSHQQCDHSFDYWWSLKTTAGTIPIKNCSGWNNAPGIWRNASIGEPATYNHNYTNYLKADPDTLLKHTDFHKFNIPNYPEVFDFYKLNPVLTTGPAIPNNWQKLFHEINADLGPSNQVDLTILLTEVLDPTYAQAVEAKWLYGPKNSITIIMGISDNQIKWARAITISKVEELKIQIRDQLKDKSLADNKLPNLIKSLVANGFKRTPMAEFEYLAKAAEPPKEWLIGLYILTIVLNIGLSYWLHIQDLFQENRKRLYI